MRLSFDHIVGRMLIELRLPSRNFVFKCAITSRAASAAALTSRAVNSSRNEPWCRVGLASGALLRFQSAVSVAVIHPGAVSELTLNGGGLSTGTQNVNTFSGGSKASIGLAKKVARCDRRGSGLNVT